MWLSVADFPLTYMCFISLYLIIYFFKSCIYCMLCECTLTARKDSDDHYNPFSFTTNKGNDRHCKPCTVRGCKDSKCHCKLYMVAVWKTRKCHYNPRTFTVCKDSESPCKPCTVPLAKAHCQKFNPYIAFSVEIRQISSCCFWTPRCRHIFKALVNVSYKAEVEGSLRY